MPWCPNCKNEYQEGITTCADCKIDLVEELIEENTVFLILGEEEPMNSLLAFLKYNEIKTAKLLRKDEENQFEIRVTKKEEERAKQAARIFLQQSLENTESTSEQEEERAVVLNMKKVEELKKPSRTYEKKTDRAEEHKSSATALIGVGGVGIILLLLYWLGFIPISFNTTSKYMITGVMGGTFILFLIMGIHALHSCRVLKQEGAEENLLQEEVWSFCKETITAEKLEELLFLDDEETAEESEEIAYFKRTEKMKLIILEQFPQLEEGFLDQMADDYYAELFGS